MPEKETTEEFLGRARKRFAAAAEDEKHLRDQFVDDLKFASPDGDAQWDPQIKQQRLAAGRPAMAFPRCHTFVAQVANEGRQNKPQIKFAPRLDADKDTAEIYEGLARFIQYSSEAQIAYDTALEYSAGASFGYYRFLTDYVDDEGDDLELKVVPVYDPLTVYGVLVPSIFGRMPKWWFVIEDIPKDDFESRYGKDSRITSLGWQEAEKQGDGWIGSETIRIAEYWWTTEERVKGRRKPKITVHTCKTNGLEILPGDDGESSETIWPGTKCNVIPVLGKQMIREGKPELFSVVRPQKAAQQLINYSKSRIAETLSTAPISPFIAAEGQTEGYEAQWKSINTSPQAVVFYKPVDVAGRPAPPPQRQTFEPPIQSLSSFVMQEVDDMKATTGIFDASLGQNGNETSGQAIARRQQQSDLTTMHYMDNLLRSFRKGGEVILELIPKIYDGEREIEILGEDETPAVAKINQEYIDEKTGKKKNHDMTAGKYSLIVTSGKAFDSKRSESFDTMQQVLQTNPDLMNVIGDIYFRNSDMAGADQVADRLQKMLPPALQENNQIPPEAQAAVAQAHQQMGQMQQELAKLTMEREAKAVEHQGKMQQIFAQSQADMTLEKLKLENSLALAEINTKAQDSQQRNELFADLWKQFHDQAHDIASQAADQAHQRAMAQIQTQNQAALADQSAQNQSVQSAQDAAQSQAAQAAQPAE